MKSLVATVCALVVGFVTVGVLGDLGGKDDILDVLRSAASGFGAALVVCAGLGCAGVVVVATTGAPRARGVVLASSAAFVGAGYFRAHEGRYAWPDVIQRDVLATGVLFVASGVLLVAVAVAIAAARVRAARGVSVVVGVAGALVYGVGVDDIVVALSQQALVLPSAELVLAALTGLSGPAAQLPLIAGVAVVVAVVAVVAAGLSKGARTKAPGGIDAVLCVVFSVVVVGAAVASRGHDPGTTPRVRLRSGVADPGAAEVVIGADTRLPTSAVARWSVSTSTSAPTLRAWLQAAARHDTHARWIGPDDDDRDVGVDVVYVVVPEFDDAIAVVGSNAEISAGGTAMDPDGKDTHAVAFSDDASVSAVADAVAASAGVYSSKPVRLFLMPPSTLSRVLLRKDKQTLSARIDGAIAPGDVEFVVQKLVLPSTPPCTALWRQESKDAALDYDVALVVGADGVVTRVDGLDVLPPKARACAQTAWAGTRFFTGPGTVTIPLHEAR